MAEGGEDYEMGDFGKTEGAEGEEDIEEMDLSDIDFTERLDYLSDHTFGSDGITHVKGVPNVGTNVGVIRRSITSDKKQAFRDELNITVRVGDGIESRRLLIHTKFEFDKNGRVSGVLFKDEKVMVRNSGGGVRFSMNKARKIVKAVEDFKMQIGKAKIEHSKTIGGMVDEINNDTATSEEVVVDITLQANTVISNMVEEREEELRDQVGGIFLSEQEIREFSGMLDPKGTDMEKIEALEAQADHYRLKELREADPVKEQLYRTVREIAELKADNIRIRMGERLEHTEAVYILTNEVENNDLNRLEKFKKWAKKNMVGLSAIAITIAGLITTVVVAARKTVSGGAKAVGGFAKALANLAKKVGPLLAPLLNLIAQVLTWGAKGISWLAKNLWVLALFMAWLLYDYWT